MPDRAQHRVAFIITATLVGLIVIAVADIVLGPDPRATSDAAVLGTIAVTLSLALMTYLKNPPPTDDDGPEPEG